MAKTVLITGATGGIGSEITRVMHASGANVIISGTKLPILENLANDLGDRVSCARCRFK